MISDDVRRSLGAAMPPAVRVLEYLVGRDVADEAAVAEGVGLSTDELRAALSALERDRLVVRVPDAPGRPTGERWTALPPRSVLTTLLAQRRLEIAVWELHVDDLERAYQESTGQAGGTALVDVVVGVQQVGALYWHLMETATQEVLHLARPPYLQPTPELLGQVNRPAMSPAVELRSVYESATFTDPVSLDTALGGRSTGAGLRLSPQVPLKLVIVDQRIAMLPAAGDDAGGASLVVHAPAIVGALAELFERVWDAAMPQSMWDFHGGGAGVRPEADEASDRGSWSPPPRLQLEGRTRSILDLMAGGLTDEAIARTLDVSRRTVQAEVTALAEKLGARTRFQIGLFAAEQGLLSRTHA
ncbi:regulatory LuxR family protein [Promicromonospora sp. AC04]|uniref:helix-turn-helix transcriptional regulator n=1 Tax=Promicromonospora sp. AC04 TaxID=2135723 RepID=UPI000D356BBB|nr:helix-turn-helix transcriptional regulator [Promicromonospora sp. AC04]PUB29815.1 regulatory LuxR family protein [Promicromonospora sp. AC04]